VLAKTTTTPTFISTTPANQQENIVDKIKQEKIPKVEISSVPSSMKSKPQGNGKDNYNNVNPFSASTAAWQGLMTYWLQMCGVSFKNVLKMTEEWYNTFYKPWLN